MKPFNLEAAKAGQPVVTRAGKEVKFIAYIPEAKELDRVIVLNGVNVQAHKENGSYYSDQAPSQYDLFMKPVKRTVWVNLYRAGRGIYHFTQAAADEYASIERIGGKAYPVEIEE